MTHLNLEIEVEQVSQTNSTTQYKQCCHLATWQWRAPLVVGGRATGSISFARLALHYALTYAHAAILTHPRASGLEN
eukprot:1141720-Prorocentrum_minimum.AAC.1